MISYPDHLKMVNQQQQELHNQYCDEVINLARKSGASVFRANGNIFVIPNDSFLDAYKNIAPDNTVGIMNVSLMGDLSNPLPFDQDQRYLKAWRANPYNRNSHLWFRVGNELVNNSLVRRRPFAYPNHLHPQQWEGGSGAVSAEHPFSWMNFMIEPTMILPPAIFRSLSRLMQTLMAQSIAKMSDARHQIEPFFRDFCQKHAILPNITVDLANPAFIKALINAFKAKSDLYASFNKELRSNPELKCAWDNVFAFARPEHRLDTFFHLALHDLIFQGTTLDQRSSPEATHDIRVHAFRVLSTAEQSANLQYANCLDLFFQLREECFLDEIKQHLPPEDYRNICLLRDIIFNQPLEPTLDREALANQRGAAYNTTELLHLFLAEHSCNNIVFLNGAWPQRELRNCNGDLTHFHLPLGPNEPGGLPQDFVDALNDPAKRTTIVAGRPFMYPVSLSGLNFHLFATPVASSQPQHTSKATIIAQQHHQVPQ